MQSYRMGDRMDEVDKPGNEIARIKRKLKLDLKKLSKKDLDKAIQYLERREKGKYIYFFQILVPL